VDGFLLYYGSCCYNSQKMIEDRCVSEHLDKNSIHLDIYEFTGNELKIPATNSFYKAYFRPYMLIFYNRFAEITSKQVR